MRAVSLLMAVATSLTLAGCMNSGQEELQQWMTQQRNQTRPQVPPIPEPKRFTPQAYLQEAALDPFNSQKLTQALRQDAAQAAVSSPLLAPELNRPKEPLESYPLDAMAMVGSLKKAGKLVALVTLDGRIYQVQPGNYLGQNYGKITRINETEVVLREIVQDATGEWVERAATLQLQEGSKK